MAMAKAANEIAMDDKIVNGCTINWSDLPFDLLELILKRLALVDLTCFKLVSPSWYAAAKSYISAPFYRPLLPQTAWLMLPGEPKNIDAGRFFSLTEKKVYTFKNLFRGFSYSETCLGSSHGWLVMFDSTTFRVHLLNPIYRVRITLPSLEFELPMRRASKVVLSSDPSRNNNFYVVVSYQKVGPRSLAFHKHCDDGDNTWTDLATADKRYGEIIFHNSHLFALCLDSNIIEVWDLGGIYPFIAMEFQPPERDVEHLSFRFYLVESLGELLFVEKCMVSGVFIYDIHKLNFTAYVWEKLECLQEQALVLSEEKSTSMSLSTRDFPELEANCIYIAKREERNSDARAVYEKCPTVVVYNLQNNDFKSYYMYQEDKPILYSPLVWIVPSPYEV